MKGEVEKVWRRQTSDGRRFDVVQVNGERYSIWEEAYLDKIQEGQIIEFDYRESGDFKNIDAIYRVESKEKAANSKDSAKDYEDPRLTKIIRMSCLRSASRLLSGLRIPYEDRAKKAIEIAKEFERYVGEEELEGNLYEKDGEYEKDEEDE